MSVICLTGQFFQDCFGKGLSYKFGEFIDGSGGNARHTAEAEQKSLLSLFSHPLN